MKKTTIPFILSLVFLVGCSGNNTSTSNSTEDSSSQSTSTSHRQNLYEQLTIALEDLRQSMTLTGRIAHGTSDGTNQTETYNDVTIEINENSYYYLEEDETTHERMEEENFYANEQGLLVNRTLDYISNKIDETTTTEQYDVVMESPLDELEVKNIDAVREKPNWFVIKRNSLGLAARIIKYLTGYETTNLPGYKPNYSYTDVDFTPSVSEFGIHFNGDEIDQFRFILETEVSEDDGTYYYEGMLFELDISDLGDTTPRSIVPLKHTEGHDKLKAALQPYAWDNDSVKNYTVHVDVSYDSNQLKGYSNDYYVDFDKQMVYNTYVFTGVKKENKDSDWVEYQYNVCYQFDSVNKQIWIYRYDPITHAFLQKDEFISYWGFEKNSMIGTTFYGASPMIGSLAPECYKDNEDNTFTPYQVYQDLAVRTFLPFEEYINQPTTSGKVLVVLNDDNTFGYFQNQITGNIATGDNSYVYATKTYKTTYQNLNNTTIPSYCVNN